MLMRRRYRDERVRRENEVRAKEHLAHIEAVIEKVKKERREKAEAAAKVKPPELDVSEVRADERV